MGLADELTKLDELRCQGVLSEAEFAQAKAALLNQPPAATDPHVAQQLVDQLAEVKHQNELALIDKAWEFERQKYFITDRFGRKQVPTSGMGIGIAVVGGVFGVFWTIMAISITGGAPDLGAFRVAKVIFPFMGILVTVGAVAFGIYCYSRAQKYEQALAAYQARRSRAQHESKP